MKIYIENNYLLIEDEGILYEALSKDVLVKRLTPTSESFSFNNVNNLDSSKSYDISLITDKNDNPYTLQGFVDFYTENTGKYSAPANGALNNFSGGFVDYNDAATSITPIPFVADTQILLTNDTLGAFTNTSYLPAGVTSIFSSNQFDWSQLSLGDMIDIRMDIDVVTNTQNQEVRIDLGLGIGGNEYEIPFEDIFEKTSGNHRIVRYNGVYMGDANTLSNPAEFRLTSDGSGTVKVNGWYCKIIRRALV